MTRSSNKQVSVYNYRRNKFLRVLYCIFLYRYGIENAISFWSSHPINKTNHLKSPGEPFRSIWEEKVALRPDYVFEVISDWGNFIRNSKKGVDECIDEMFRFEGGMEGYLLREIAPLVNHFIDRTAISADPRKDLIMFFRLLLRLIFPDSRTKMLHGEENDNWYEVKIGINMKKECGNYLPYEFAKILGRFLTSIPTIFLHPAYESVKVIADIAHPNQLLNQEFEFKIIDNDLLVEGKPYGRLVWMPDNIKYLTGSDNEKAMFWENDFVNPRTGKTLLSKGTYYCTPGCILLVNSCKNYPKPENPLKGIANSFAPEERASWDNVINLHNELLKQVEGQLIFSYNPQKEKLFFQGTPFVNRSSAKILARLFSLYVSKEQQRFDLLQLKYDKTLALHPHDHNLDLKLSRLIKLLEKRNFPVQIKKISKGSYFLDVKGELEYREEAV